MSQFSMRCVHCGRAKAGHCGSGHSCKGGMTNYETMELPAGKTCNDCRHIGFCVNFLGDVRARSSCDWFPIRFQPKAAGA